MNNRFVRTIALIGEDNFKKLSNAYITIIGVGGVGGSTAESLVRAGVGKLKLIDFDEFELSNLNRQLGATSSTIGMKKVSAFKERFHEINPDCEIIAIDEKLDENNSAKLLQDSSYIADICDDAIAKKLIIEYAIKENIPFISAMGAGNRLDISKLMISTLDKTKYCQLAKKMRQLLPKPLHKKIKVAFYDSESLPYNKEAGVVGTISTSPSYMGIRIASEIINEIIGK